MKRTALILAGAAAFDLGVMVVAAQAQQLTQQPLVRPATNVAVSPERGRENSQTGDRVSGSTDSDRGQASRERYIDKSNPMIFIKIDNVNTARACIAQRGEVVTRDGVQQCALPADPGNDRARPNRR